MRRATRALIAIALFVVMAAPAAADAPILLSESFTFVDENPCTGEDHQVTIDVETSVHLHDDRVVIYESRSGTTDSGYTMIAGTLSFVDNGNVVRGAFVDQWRNDDGSKFRARGNFLINLNTEELLVDNFSLTCIGNR